MERVDIIFKIKKILKETKGTKKEVNFKITVRDIRQICEMALFSADKNFMTDSLKASELMDNIPLEGEEKVLFNLILEKLEAGEYPRSMQLAKEMERCPGTVSSILQRLISKGYVMKCEVTRRISVLKNT